MLAEELGTLGKIGSGRIPSRVTAGGVQAVLLRRLRRVPAEARPLLFAAAVFGRELDLIVLRGLQDAQSGPIEAHLATCAAVAVLEVSENRWRFAHDKLRETLLAEASEDERKSWHRRIGETMESVYAADLDPHAAALGYHFDQAGQSGPALRYKLLAGKRAMRSGAVQEAIVHLDRAVDLLARTNAGPAARVNALGLLSQAYNSAGRTKEAGQTLAAMLVDAGFQRDRSALGRLSSIARLALQHAAFQLHAPRSTTVTKPLDRGTAEHPAGGAADELVDNCSTALVAAGEAIALTLSPAQILEVALFWTTLTERALNPANMALAYNSLGVMLSMTPIGWLADGYFRRSGELLAQAPDPPPGLRVHLAAREAVMHINHGQWATASKSMADQIGYQARVGNWSQELCALAMQTRIELSCGKTDELLVSLARMELLAHRVNSALYLCFSLCCHGLLALRAGETDRARRLLRQASEHERRARDGSVSVFWGGCSALAALRDGDPVEARQVADATLESLLAASSIALATGIAALAETYLVLWSQAPAKAGKVELHRRLRQSLAALRMSGVMIPADRPIGFLWHGQYAAQLGHPKLAAWLLRKAIEAAVGYRMPFEEGLARQALAAVNRKSNRIPL